MQRCYVLLGLWQAVAGVAAGPAGPLSVLKKGSDRWVRQVEPSADSIAKTLAGMDHEKAHLRKTEENSSPSVPIEAEKASPQVVSIERALLNREQIIKRRTTNQAERQHTAHETHEHHQITEATRRALPPATSERDAQEIAKRLSRRHTTVSDAVDVHRRLQPDVSVEYKAERPDQSAGVWDFSGEEDTFATPQSPDPPLVPVGFVELDREYEEPVQA